MIQEYSDTLTHTWTEGEAEKICFMYSIFHNEMLVKNK